MVLDKIPTFEEVKNWVNSQPSTVDVKTSDPSSPEDGQTWIRSDL
jgi:hypothetical protein